MKRRRLLCSYNCFFILSIFANLIFLQTIFLQKADMSNEVFCTRRQEDHSLLKVGQEEGGTLNSGVPRGGG